MSLVLDATPVATFGGSRFGRHARRAPRRHL